MHVLQLGFFFSFLKIDLLNRCRETFNWEIIIESYRIFCIIYVNTMFDLSEKTARVNVVVTKFKLIKKKPIRVYGLRKDFLSMFVQLKILQFFSVIISSHRTFHFVLFPMYLFNKLVNYSWLSFWICNFNVISIQCIIKSKKNSQ